ncbi:helix-turn-helix transcriptional regulator [Pontiella sulfatireligans]|uniref:RCS-specific HTH-type transcriptional activator RclR n=1 Tax=Pontiella sulfatireligans TaxID=2750658 RepID=A0A6C2UKM4_9BACT|nr:AraC family transcriptional regulator [Pontiella sulfatireligans]VGO20658.1 RCS-specific HTH-type transcriptional activator RclR [Pontiella sulfatireligans]
MTRKSFECNYDNRIAEYYDINLIPPEDSGATVIGGGYEHCGEKYRVERNDFKFYVIEYIEAGEGTLMLHEKEQPLHAGTIFFYGPRIPHKIISNPDNPLIKHYVVFAGHKLVDLVKSLRISKAPLHVTHPYRVDNMFRNLLWMGGNEGCHRHEICLLQLKQIVLYVDESAVLQKVSRSPAWQKYLRVREYVEQNYADIWRLEQIAQNCHLDKTYLCRLFKQYGEESPNKLLVRLKMRRAADMMLSNPTMLIKQVADAVGFPDPYHFSRVFKRTFGVSPEIYEKTVRPSD